MLPCPKCEKELSSAFLDARDLQPCPACRIPVWVEAYPALLAPPAIGDAGENLLIEGESSCFYHPAKRASAACESCGRFLCALCDVDLNGQHLCPACLQTGKRKGKLKQLQNQRMLYDTMALTFAALPLVILPFIYFTIITGPLAIYVAIRHWKDEGSIVRRGKWRMILALVLGILEVLGWIAIFYLISHGGIFGRRHHV